MCGGVNTEYQYGYVVGRQSTPCSSRNRSNAGSLIEEILLCIMSGTEMNSMPSDAVGEDSLSGLPLRKFSLVYSTWAAAYHDL